MSRRHAKGTNMREFQIAALNTDEILQGGPDAVEDLQSYIDELGDDGELQGRTLKDVLRERALKSAPKPPPEKKRWQPSPSPCRIAWQVEDDVPDEQISLRKVAKTGSKAKPKAVEQGASNAAREEVEVEPQLPQKSAVTKEAAVVPSAVTDDERSSANDVEMIGSDEEDQGEEVEKDEEQQQEDEEEEKDEDQQQEEAEEEKDEDQQPKDKEEEEDEDQQQEEEEQEKGGDQQQEDEEEEKDEDWQEEEEEERDKHQQQEDEEEEKDEDQRQEEGEEEKDEDQQQEQEEKERDEDQQQEDEQEDEEEDEEEAKEEETSSARTLSKGRPNGRIKREDSDAESGGSAQVVRASQRLAPEDEVESEVDLSVGLSKRADTSQPGSLASKDASQVEGGAKAGRVRAAKKNRVQEDSEQGDEKPIRRKRGNKTKEGAKAFATEEVPKSGPTEVDVNENQAAPKKRRRKPLDEEVRPPVPTSSGGVSMCDQETAADTVTSSAKPKRQKRVAATESSSSHSVSHNQPQHSAGDEKGGPEEAATENPLLKGRFKGRVKPENSDAEESGGARLPSVPARPVDNKVVEVEEEKEDEADLGQIRGVWPSRPAPPPSQNGNHKPGKRGPAKRLAVPEVQEKKASRKRRSKKDAEDEKEEKTDEDMVAEEKKEAANDTARVKQGARTKKRLRPAAEELQPTDLLTREGHASGKQEPRPAAAASSQTSCSSSQPVGSNLQDDFRRTLVLDLLRVILVREERASAIVHGLVELARDVLKPNQAEGHSTDCVEALEKLTREL